MEKIIHGVEFQNPDENCIEKEPEIIATVDKNYKIIRVSQYLFTEVAIFLEYIHSLDPNEIQQLDDGINGNGRGFINLLEIDNSFELLSRMQTKNLLIYKAEFSTVLQLK